MIDSKEISVVIQGAVSRETVILIRSIRKYLPEAEVVLSTWKGSQVEELDYDKLVLNEDPGAMSSVIAPARKANFNRQIISSREGIKVSTRPYILKCRSDMEILGTRFLEYWDQYSVRDPEYVLAEHKMIIPSLYTIKGEAFGNKVHPTPFHISDWWVFGLRQDVEQLWDAPIVDTKEFSRYFVYRERPIEYNVPLIDERVWRFPPEQYIGVSYARRWREIDFPDFLSYEKLDMEESERFLVNNFIVLESKESQLLLNKDPYYNMCQNALFIAEHVKDTIYRREVYEADYERYCLTTHTSGCSERKVNSTSAEALDKKQSGQRRAEEQDFAIVTPTYRGHFQFIPAYLQSFRTFVTDKKQTPIYFTVGGEEYFEFCNLIQPYVDDLCIHVLPFEMILEYYGVKETPQQLLDRYGRYSFQSLKKFYTMLYVRKSKYLILDSETVWIQPTSMEEEFERYFASPFVPCSPLALRGKGTVAEGVVENVEEILKYTTNRWYIESLSWFYERQILEEMFEELGGPLEVVRNMHAFEKKKKRTVNLGLMEIILYTIYLEKRHSEQYRFIDMYQELQQCLGEKGFYEYLSSVDDVYLGECGIAEHMLQFLTRENWSPLAELYRENGFTIIRCETGSEENYLLQKKFLAASGVKILAASQDHRFLPDRLGWTELRRQKDHSWRSGELRVRLRSWLKKVMMHIFPAYRVVTDVRFKLESFIGETNGHFEQTRRMLESTQAQLDSLQKAKNGAEEKEDARAGEKK